MYANNVFNCTIDYCFYEESQVIIAMLARARGVVGFTGTYSGELSLSGCGSQTFPNSAYMPSEIIEGYLIYLTQRFGYYLGSKDSKLNKRFRFYEKII